MSRPIVLINSGAYIPQELLAEFGPLPPAFLPIGMRRLYELQQEVLQPLDADLYLTIPESLPLPLWDQDRLEEIGVRVIRSPDGLSLGAALLHALSSIGFTARPLRILHGDTLVDAIDFGRDDAISVAPGGDGYRWGTVRGSGGRVEHVSAPGAAGETAGERLSGYFAFASASAFAEALALAQGDFFEALNGYASDHGLDVLHAGRWLDFGHVQTFFRSRREITTARAFNALEIDGARVRKRSRDGGKLRAEAYWLTNIPAALRPYAARVLHEAEDADGFFYDTEYEYTPTLAELFVFGRLGLASWRRILESCKAFLDLAAGEDGAAPGALTALAVEKTNQRLEAYARASGLDLDAPNSFNGRAAPSLRACMDSIAGLVGGAGDRPSVMHGDFCFSNILYNFRTERIRVIDPRGQASDGRASLFGDVRYDVAKLMHSITGRYDLIIAGHHVSSRPGPNEFTLNFRDDEHRARVEEAAGELEMGGVRLDDAVVAAVVVTLFLSMVPLHDDRPDRQTAFIANALRLFLRLEDARA